MDLLVFLIIWVFSIFGATNGIVVSALLRPFRDWITYSKIVIDENTGYAKEATVRKWKLPGKLIACPMCLSFWLGMLWSLFIWSPTSLLGANPVAATISDMFLASITSWIFYITIGKKQFSNG